MSENQCKHYNPYGSCSDCEPDLIPSLREQLATARAALEEVISTYRHSSSCRIAMLNNYCRCGTDEIEQVVIARRALAGMGEKKEDK